MSYFIRWSPSSPWREINEHEYAMHDGRMSELCEIGKVVGSNYEMATLKRVEK